MADEPRGDSRAGPHLSLSVRVAETPDKTGLGIPFEALVELAAELGYAAICMRASAAGTQTAPAELARMRTVVEDAGLTVSMVTADLDVPLNNERGPQGLRDIAPSLAVAEALGADLIRVCLKSPADVEHARRAADLAARRGRRLAHQCHTRSLFERVDESLEVLEQIGHPNFGLIFEPANLMLCGEPHGPETLARFSPYLMNVYLQNHRLDPAGPEAIDTWTLGRRRFHNLPIWEPGGVDVEAVARGLGAIGYQGFVTVHQAFAAMFEPRTAAQRSAAYLRTVLGP